MEDDPLGFRGGECILFMFSFKSKIILKLGHSNLEKSGSLQSLNLSNWSCFLPEQRLTGVNRLIASTSWFSLTQDA